MKTNYFCGQCRLEWSEKKIPNMNKRHRRCGKIARVVAFEEAPDGEGEDDSEES